MTFPKIKPVFNRFVGNPVETDLSAYRRLADEVRAQNLADTPDTKLRAMALDLIGEARTGKADPTVPNKSLYDRGRRKMVIRSFSLVLEASRRALGLNPFDVQIIAGLAMAEGKIVELPTGEGKTLAAVFPAYYHALSGSGVHVLTFNDYLARRDAAWMRPVFNLLGIEVGCAREGMSPAAKREAYARDVTYATAKEAGFDFLRDSIAYSPGNQVLRPFHAAIVDEADSILIDEARIPLVIAGLGEPVAWDAGRLADLVARLDQGRDFQTDAEHRNVFLTEAGAAKLEAGLGSGSLYDSRNLALLEAANCALHAAALLRRDVDYIVRGGLIEIVDEFTGRVVNDRHWPDGLQAAVEAKEGIARGSKGRILGSISLQHFFGLYPTLAGMTGTARTGAAEFKEFYRLDTVIVPPHTPCVRDDRPDSVFTHREAKLAALVREIRQVHAGGRPILVGTASVGESEALAAALEREGIHGAVLNAKNDEFEAGIIAAAGTLGAVTISTNMAGRGTDIKLHPRVADLGGLYVIGTNRHESLRIDRQLRGRAGRQGDPGSSRFFISFDDDIFVRFGLRDMLLKRYRLSRRDECPEDPFVRRDVAHAQRVIEGQNFDIRRSLHKYSDLIERQRRLIQDWRAGVLSGNGGAGGDGKPAGIVRRTAPELYERGEGRFGQEAADELERRLTLLHIDRAWSDHLAWVTDTRESIHLMGLGGKSPLDGFVRSATEMFLAIRPLIEEAVAGDFRTAVDLKGDSEFDLGSIKGPSSTWTYLVNEDQFGWGMELLKGGNIGFAALAAGPSGVLFMLFLLVKRLFKKKTG
jgi:preprotein translocase subunit SecA